MTALAVTNDLPLGRTAKEGSHGASDEADHLDSLVHAAQGYKTPENTGTLQLRNVFEECSRPGWDGQDAKALGVEAFRLAAKILESMPSMFPKPEIVPEPDGEIALEWEGADGSLFSISVSGEETIAFAGMYSDGAKVHGTEPARGGVLSRAVFEYISKAAFSR